jgi:hypothetical protein
MFGTNYTLSSMMLDFAAGQDTVDVALTVIDDTAHEGDETVSVYGMSLFADGAGPAYTVGTGTAEFTIADNDPLPTVSVTKLNDAYEGIIPGFFRFTRTGDTGTDLVVTYTVPAIGLPAATPGIDYASLSGTVTIRAGAASADVGVVAVDDGIVECAEQVTVVTAASSAYAVSGAQGTATLAIHDRPVAQIAFLPYALSASNSADTLFLTDDNGAPLVDTVIDIRVSVTDGLSSGFSPTGWVTFKAVADEGTTTVLGAGLLDETGLAKLTVGTLLVSAPGTVIVAEYGGDTTFSPAVANDNGKTVADLRTDTPVTDNPVITSASRNLTVVFVGGTSSAEQQRWLESARGKYGPNAYLVTTAHSVGDMGTILSQLPAGSVLNLILGGHGSARGAVFDGLNHWFDGAALAANPQAVQQIRAAFGPGGNFQFQSCNAATFEESTGMMKGVANALGVGVWGATRGITAWDDGYNGPNDPGPWIVVMPGN